MPPLLFLFNIQAWTTLKEMKFRTALSSSITNADKGPVDEYETDCLSDVYAIILIKLKWVISMWHSGHETWRMLPHLIMRYRSSEILSLPSNEILTARVNFPMNAFSLNLVIFWFMWVG